MENQDNKSKATSKEKKNTVKGSKSKTTEGSTATKQKQPKKVKEKKKRTPLQKVLFFLIKWTIILLILFFSVAVGLVVGYSIIGEGHPSDVFDMDTWRHIYNLVFNV